MQSVLWFYRAGLLACMGLLLAGCGDGKGGKPPVMPVAPEGVIFTYPVNGQSDVPLATRFYVTFSKAVNTSAINAACSVDAGSVTGNFCLIDPGNQVVPITPVVSGKIVQFESSALKQGTRYSLYVRGAVLGGDTNLPQNDPLLTFTTSQMDSIKGSNPVVRAINGEAPDVFSAVLPTRPAPRYPFMDFATVRVEFSEPLDEKTVVDGTSFQFVEVDGATEIPVAGSLMARKQHVSFDPHEDLKPGVTYRLKLGTAIKDLDGEALAAIQYELVPKQANANNNVMIQHFTTTVAYGEGGFPARSELTGQPVNAIDLHSPLIGDNDINLLPSTLQAELADPGNFEGTIPFVIRKGNSLEITGLDLKLGGAVPANLNTGSIKATFLNDATGFMGRNPYQSPSLQPDDEKSPVFVYLLFDLALTGSDDKGNAVLNQTIPHVQATGTAKVVNGNLEIETVRTLTMDLLGLDLAPAHMVLGIKSDVHAQVENDLQAPRLTSTYPADGGVDFPIRDGISLIFSKPIDNAGLQVGNQISLRNGASSVPFQLAFDGSTILLKSDSPLSFNTSYQIELNGLKDMNGNDLSLDGADASGGDGIIAFTTENPSSTNTIGPMISSIHTGAACALTGTTATSPGRCVGGAAGDTLHQLFEMPADGYLDVQFSQPMNVSTLALGTTCSNGTVQVVRLNGGACAGVVPGSLVVDTRSIRFKPTQPWVEGADYRLTLVPGANASCAAGEICSGIGATPRPLNPDPLNGAEAADAGGANVVINFKGKQANAKNAVYLPLKLEPFTDMNGNGFRDGGEVARLENSATVNQPTYGGIVTSASLVGGGSIYFSGTLPVTIGLPEPLTIDGAVWNMNLAGDSQIPVRITPGVLYGTSITMQSTARVVAASLLPINVDIEDTHTGVSILRFREVGGPITGYIVQEEGEDQPQFVGQLDLYMDAPDMEIKPESAFLASLSSVSHDLKSKPISAIVKGPITFMDDGRIVIEQSNVVPINITINVVATVPLSPNQSGTIALQIPADAMKLRLVGSPLKGRR